MTISLTVGATVLTLHPDLFWADEHDWQPVVQTAERSLTGALVVHTGAMLAGRPITLRPENDRSGWMSLATLQQLEAWAAVPAQAMTLTLRGQAWSVAWRHQDAPALSAAPVLHRADIDGADFYLVTLKLMSIA